MWFQFNSDAEYEFGKSCLGLKSHVLFFLEEASQKKMHVSTMVCYYLAQEDTLFIYPRHPSSQARPGKISQIKL